MDQAEDGAMNNGGYAFPRKLPSGEFRQDEAMRIIEEHAGMTLRDYFAAKAMATMLIGATLPTKESRAEHVPRMCSLAYEIADYMLAARDLRVAEPITQPPPPPPPPRPKGA